MYRIKCLLSTALTTLVVVGGGAKQTLAATAAVPTAGVAATSIVVGAAGAAEGSVEDTRSKWNRKFLIFGGILLTVVDPDPAIYLGGTSVIEFPKELLEFQELTWYGPFSDMSPGDSGPTCDEGCVQNSGFFNDVSLFTPQDHNPNITYNTSVDNGVLTVSWTPEPGIVAEANSVNIFGIAFKNISGQDLFVEIAPSNSQSANLLQNTSMQSLTCIPPNEEEPQPCGYPDEPIRFTVTPVPEPLTVLGTGTAIVFGTVFKRKLAKAKKK